MTSVKGPSLQAIPMAKHPTPDQRSAKVHILRTKAAEDSMASFQGQQVSTLKAQESAIHDLRERERDLEVKRIAAQVALKALTPRRQMSLAPEKACRIIETLDHVRTLQSELDARDRQFAASYQKANADALKQLQAGEQALVAWLEAPRVRDLQKARRAIRAVLFAVTFGAISAAIAVHPAFLLLLFPVGPIVILLRSGQDIAWRRLGAERRFKETGLEGLAEWNEPAVRRRIGELRATTVPPSSPSTNREQASPLAADLESALLVAELTEEKQNLVDLLMEGGLGLDALDEDLEQQLRLTAEIERSQRDLSDVQKARKLATAESSEVREQLFAYLARQGLAPANGRADTEALVESLDRLRARRGQDKPTR